MRSVDMQRNKETERKKTIGLSTVEVEEIKRQREARKTPNQKDLSTYPKKELIAIEIHKGATLNLYKTYHEFFAFLASDSEKDSDWLSSNRIANMSDTFSKLRHQTKDRGFPQSFINEYNKVLTDEGGLKAGNIEPFKKLLNTYSDFILFIEENLKSLEMSAIVWTAQHSSNPKLKEKCIPLKEKCEQELFELCRKDIQRNLEEVRRKQKELTNLQQEGKSIETRIEEGITEYAQTIGIKKDTLKKMIYSELLNSLSSKIKNDLKNGLKTYLNEDEIIREIKNIFDQHTLNTKEDILSEIENQIHQTSSMIDTDDESLKKIIYLKSLDTLDSKTLSEFDNCTSMPREDEVIFEVQSILDDIKANYDLSENYEENKKLVKQMARAFPDEEERNLVWKNIEDKISTISIYDFNYTEYEQAVFATVAETVANYLKEKEQLAIQQAEKEETQPVIAQNDAEVIQPELPKVENIEKEDYQPAMLLKLPEEKQEIAAAQVKTSTAGIFKRNQLNHAEACHQAIAKTFLPVEAQKKLLTALESGKLRDLIPIIVWAANNPSALHVNDINAFITKTLKAYHHENNAAIQSAFNDLKKQLGGKATQQGIRLNDWETAVKSITTKSNQQNQVKIGR